MTKVKLIPLLALILLSAGCRIEGEVWVKNSGAGHGVFHISGIPFVTKADIEDEFRGSCDEVVVTELDGGGYKAEIEWSDFEKMFQARKVNEDETILLHFGKADEAPINLTVHVDGKIDESKTSGRLRDSETVFFGPGTDAYLVYKPNSMLWPFYIGFYLLLGCALIASLIAEKVFGIDVFEKIRALANRKVEQGRDEYSTENE